VVLEVQSKIMEFLVMVKMVDQVVVLETGGFLEYLVEAQEL
jgi:hypothetical protein